MLAINEFAAALASLGIVYRVCQIIEEIVVTDESKDEDLYSIHTQLSQDFGALTCEAFITFLIEMMKDSTSIEQLREAFQGIAGDKPFVTQADLAQSQMPEVSVAYLLENMPAHTEVADGLDYEAYLHSVFEIQPT